MNLSKLATSAAAVLLAISFPIGVVNAQISKYFVLDAKAQGWQNGKSLVLEPNKAYVVLPDPRSRCRTSPGASATDFHGTEDMYGGAIDVPGRLRLGGIGVLVWHHHSNDPATASYEILCFPPGCNHHFIKTGRFGGSMLFMVADTANGDNSGHLGVSVEEDDGTGTKIRCELPIRAVRDASEWNIDAQGGVTGKIHGTIGASLGGGTKSYSSALVVEFFDGTHYEATLDKGWGRQWKDFTDTHEEARPSIPIQNLAKIRRVYMNDAVDKGPGSAIEWAKEIAKALKEGDQVYRDIKNAELVQDAVKLYSGGTGGNGGGEAPESASSPLANPGRHKWQSEGRSTAEVNPLLPIIGAVLLQQDGGPEPQRVQPLREGQSGGVGTYTVKFSAAQSGTVWLGPQPRWYVVRVPEDSTSRIAILYLHNPKTGGENQEVIRLFPGTTLYLEGARFEIGKDGVKPDGGSASPGNFQIIVTPLK